MRVAVRKLRVEDVAKLQALVVENFDAIEPGLTVLDARLLLGHATIDVIGVDASGSLVLGAVGFSANEEMLLKAVEAYSWCLEYPEAIVRLYPSCQVSEDRPPRLLFVVERMPDAFHRKIKQLGFPEVDCVEFRHLEFDGIAAVYFESLLRLRKTTVPVSTRIAEAEALTPATTENVIAMSSPAPRANGAKLQKLLTQASTEAPASSAGPRAAAERMAPVREPAPVVSMVSRQATVAAPWTERPRPAVEPVALREPEPLIADPLVEAMAERAALDLSLDAEPAVEPAVEPVAVADFAPTLARPVMEAIPSMAPSHVVTATAPSPERVSFKDLATALLGAETQPVVAASVPTISEPLVLESAVAPMVAESVPVAPLELMLESAPAPVVEEPKPVVVSAAIEESLKAALAQPSLAVEASAAPAPAREEPKAAAPALPQGFEGLKFPNDGVLTRQWMEFLSQMSSAK
jgi:hypothetical protein